MQYDEFRAMSCAIVLAAEGEPPAVAEAFRAAREFIARGEQRLTRFSETSELAQLNRAQSAWFHASPDLFDVVYQARGLADQTCGLFDPTLLDVVEHLGYDRTLDDLRGRDLPAPSSPLPAERPAFNLVQFDMAARAIRLPAGARLDLGGIAKGWITERAAQRMARFCRACAVSAGGDLFALGRPEGEPGWPVALEDPRDPERVLAVLMAPPGAVATSAVTKRRWVQAGLARHHLIDPRTRQPAETDWLSVTVLAPRAAVAEVFAKALLIAGSRQAPEIATQRGDLAYIAVDADGGLWGSAAAKELLNAQLERV